MGLAEYAIMFVFVAIMGAGLPGPGDATLIAAGALAGDGKLNVWIVLAVAMVAWMLGSVIGFSIGAHGGRPLLDHPGRLEKSRRKLLAKGDRTFGRYTFVASVTMPAFVSDLPGAILDIHAGSARCWYRLGWNVRRDSYFLGEEIAKLVGSAGVKVVLGVIVIVAHRTGYQVRGVEVARHPASTAG